jgi:pimeloyl-ACP methyl ester carboxylesterase
MPLDRLTFFQPRPTQSQLPLFIYFPGMDGTGRLFYKQVESLAAKFDIRCLELPRHDRSNWSVMVERSLQLIDTELTEDRQLYLCGESFGACWAMQVAAQLPERIDKLTLINPASSFVRLPWLTEGSALSSMLPDRLYPLSTRILANFLVNADRVPAHDRQKLIDAMLSVPPQTAAWRLTLLRQFQIDTILPSLVDIPTLLIAGQRDRLLPSAMEVSYLSKMLPKSSTVILPDSGHACLLEQDLYPLAALATEANHTHPRSQTGDLKMASH